MIRTTRLILALVIATVVTPARAEPSARDVISEFKAKVADTDIYVAGVEQGLSWYGTAISSQKRKELYCEPERLALTPDQDINIVSSYLQRRKDRSAYDAPFGMILLDALEDAFPCKEK